MNEWGEGARKMAEQVKSLAPKADDLGLISGIHITEGENWCSYVVLLFVSHGILPTHQKLFM